VRNYIQKLIGKRVRDLRQTPDEIIIQTECGIEEKILAKDYFGPFAQFKSCNIKNWKGRVIKDIKVEQYGFISVAFIGVSYSFDVYGIQEIIEVRHSKNKKEILLVAKRFQYAYEHWKIHYIKDGENWTLSEFGTNSKEAYDYANKYDLIHHPAIRLSTIF
jgi:hypothetical protein